MSQVIDKLKNEFIRNRKKAMILGVLSVVMLGLFGKAFFEIAPRAATASPVSPAGTPDAATSLLARTAANESEERIRQSQQLWGILREKRGVDVEGSFHFDPAFYTLDPSRRPALAAEPDQKITEVNSTQPVRSLTNEELDRRARLAAIRDQAKSLIVRSTVVGASRPVAVINDKILTVGDRIAGFEVVAIRAREVEFKKEGVTLAVKMADDARQQ